MESWLKLEGGLFQSRCIHSESQCGVLFFREMKHGIPASMSSNSNVFNRFQSVSIDFNRVQSIQMQTSPMCTFRLSLNVFVPFFFVCVPTLKALSRNHQDFNPWNPSIEWQEAQRTLKISCRMEPWERYWLSGRSIASVIVRKRVRICSVQSIRPNCTADVSVKNVMCPTFSWRSIIENVLKTLNRRALVLVGTGDGTLYFVHQQQKTIFW